MVDSPPFHVAVLASARLERARVVGMFAQISPLAFHLRAQSEGLGGWCLAMRRADVLIDHINGSDETPWLTRQFEPHDSRLGREGRINHPSADKSRGSRYCESLPFLPAGNEACADIAPDRKSV